MTIFKVLKSEYNLSCKILNGKGTFMNDKILTNIYLNCTRVQIQLAIFYKRGDFIWIGADETTPSMESGRWFGDHPRALNKYFTINIYINRKEFYFKLN